jgi:hypothetical protein
MKDLPVCELILLFPISCANVDATSQNTKMGNFFKTKIVNLRHGVVKTSSCNLSILLAGGYMDLEPPTDNTQVGTMVKSQNPFKLFL